MLLINNTIGKVLTFKVITIPFIQPTCSPSHCIVIDSYLVIGIYFIGMLLGIELGRNRDKIMEVIKTIIKGEKL